MKASINFGKIAYTNPKRKANQVEVEIELREETTKAGFNYKELSISANVWNCRHTDIVMGGQCLDELKKYVHNSRFTKIHKLWKEWHLNGLNAGNQKQRSAIDEWIKQGNKYDYDNVCIMLQEIGIYEDLCTEHGLKRDYANEPYTYGTDWIVRPIPQDVEREIIRTMIM